MVYAILSKKYNTFEGIFEIKKQAKEIKNSPVSYISNYRKPLEIVKLSDSQTVDLIRRLDDVDNNCLRDINPKHILNSNS
ncbi:MAG: hypothetical protein ACOCP8_04165 [archaeon]